MRRIGCVARLWGRGSLRLSSLPVLAVLVAAILLSSNPSSARGASFLDPFYSMKDGGWEGLAMFEASGMPSDGVSEDSDYKYRDYGCGACVISMLVHGAVYAYDPRFPSGGLLPVSPVTVWERSWAEGHARPKQESKDPERPLIPWYGGIGRLFTGWSPDLSDPLTPMVPMAVRIIPITYDEMEKRAKAGQWTAMRVVNPKQKRSHFVVVSGWYKNSEHYPAEPDFECPLIVDPLWAPEESRYWDPKLEYWKLKGEALYVAYSPARGNTYDNYFAVGWSADPDPCYVWQLACPAELLITDDQGRRVGRPGESRPARAEIPGAYYGPPVDLSGAAPSPEVDTPKQAYLPFAEGERATYRLQVIGTGEGNFALSGYDPDSASGAEPMLAGVAHSGQVVGKVEARWDGRRLEQQAVTNFTPEAKAGPDQRLKAFSGQGLFDASGSFDLDGEITSYVWDFGDGIVANGSQVSHCFLDAGIYLVRLTVLDDQGARATDTVLVTVPWAPLPLELRGSTTRTNVSTEGQEASGTIDPTGSAKAVGSIVSADGNRILFQSEANNLVVGDINGVADLFVHDRRTRMTTCVSVRPADAPRSTYLSSADFSGDGRWVVYAAESGSAQVVVLKDTVLGTTTTIGRGVTPSVSFDGRYVAFCDPYVSLQRSPIMLYDATTGAIREVSTSAAGVPANDRCSSPKLSGDGSNLVFVSAATNLTADSALVAGYIGMPPTRAYRKSLVDSSIRQLPGQQPVRVTPPGAPPFAGSWEYPQSSPRGVSFDCSRVFYNMYTPFPVQGTGGKSWLGVWDASTDTTVDVTVGSNGILPDAALVGSGMSADGQFVTFTSTATNILAPYMASAPTHVYRRDIASKETTRISVSAEGLMRGESAGGGSMSADGSVVGFFSDAPNLVPRDTNGVGDSFVRDLGFKRRSGSASRVSSGLLSLTEDAKEETCRGTRSPARLR